MTGVSDQAELIETLRETRRALDEEAFVEALQLLVRIRDWEVLDADVDAQVQELRAGPGQANIEAIRSWLDDTIAEQTRADTDSDGTTDDPSDSGADVFADLEEISDSQTDFSANELVPATGSQETSEVDAVDVDDEDDLEALEEPIADIEVASSVHDEETLDEPPTSESESLPQTQTPEPGASSPALDDLEFGTIDSTPESSSTDSHELPPRQPEAPVDPSSSSRPPEESDDSPPREGSNPSSSSGSPAGSDDSPHREESAPSPSSSDDSLEAEELLGDMDDLEIDEPPSDEPALGTDSDHDGDAFLEGTSDDALNAHSTDTSEKTSSSSATPTPSSPSTTPSEEASADSSEGEAMELSFDDFEEIDDLEGKASDDDFDLSFGQDDVPAGDADDSFAESAEFDGGRPDDGEEGFSFEEFDDTERTPPPSSSSDDETPVPSSDREEDMDLGSSDPIASPDASESVGDDLGDLDMSFEGGAPDEESDSLETDDDEAMSVSFDEFEGTEPGGPPPEDAAGLGEASDDEEREAIDLDIDGLEPEDEEDDELGGAVQDGPVEPKQEEESAPLFEPGSSADLVDGELEASEDSEPRTQEPDDEQARYRASHSSLESIDDSLEESSETSSARSREETNEQPSSESADNEFFDLADSISEHSDESQEGDHQKRQYQGDPLVEIEDDLEDGSSDAFESSGTLESEASSADVGTEESEADPSSSDTQVPGLNADPVDVPEASSEPSSHVQSGAFRLLDEAEQLIESDNHESARDLVQSVLERNPDNHRAQEILKGIEEVQSSSLADQLGSLEDIPTQNVAMSELDLSGADLDHRCGYVLSLIDGRITFEDILEISSMRRQETLELLVDMLREDIIDVR